MLTLRCKIKTNSFNFYTALFPTLLSYYFKSSVVIETVTASHDGIFLLESVIRAFKHGGMSFEMRGYKKWSNFYSNDG